VRLKFFPIVLRVPCLPTNSAKPGCCRGCGQHSSPVLSEIMGPFTVLNALIVCEFSDASDGRVHWFCKTGFRSFAVISKLLVVFLL
jgi:hypothetical protein